MGPRVWVLGKQQGGGSRLILPCCNFNPTQGLELQQGNAHPDTTQEEQTMDTVYSHSEVVKALKELESATVDFDLEVFEVTKFDQATQARLKEGYLPRMISALRKARLALRNEPLLDETDGVGDSGTLSDGSEPVTALLALESVTVDFGLEVISALQYDVPAQARLQAGYLPRLTRAVRKARLALQLDHTLE